MTTIQDRVIEQFASKYGIYSRRKFTKEGTHVGYRVYKGRPHIFYDWFPRNGTLTRFKDLKWEKMGRKYMSVDEVANAVGKTVT